MARAADQVVVLVVAEDARRCPSWPWSEVVARLAVDLVGRPDVVGRRRVHVEPARRVVEELDRPHDDAQAAAVLEAGGLVVGELLAAAVAPHDPVEVAVVAEDRVGVPGVGLVQHDVAGVARVELLEARVASRRRRRSSPSRPAALVGSVRLYRFELPPMRSSWPRLPKITSLPPPPST